MPFPNWKTEHVPANVRALIGAPTPEPGATP
jgi:hypothetical protein